MYVDKRHLQIRVVCILLRYLLLHECSCIIEVIEQVEEKRSNVRLTEHFIAFWKEV